MKTLKCTFLTLLLLIGISTFARQDRYTAAMSKGMELMAVAKVSDDFSLAANHFERIARVETSQWRPAYYASYCHLISALMAGKDKMDPSLDKALALIAEADVIAPEHSEIYALKGYIEFMKMSVDPMARLPFMKKAAASLDKAIALNPENPRPYYIKGQNLFFTPAAFGGGKQTARPLLELADAKFRTFKAANAMDPNWGIERNTALLQQCK